MANTTVRDDLMSPCFFVVHTSFATQIVLDKDATNGGSAPTGINHLPCALFVEAGAGDVLALKDASGTTRSKTFTAAWTGTIRIAPQTIETTTDVISITALYNPEP